MERRPEFVRDHREELILGPVRLIGFPPRTLRGGVDLAFVFQQTLSLSLQTDALADVAGDRRGSDDGAGCVPHGGDRDGDVKALSILPDALRLVVLDSLAAP